MQPPLSLDLGWMGRVSKVIPRVTSPEDWARAGPVRRWLITARAIAFLMTLGSVCLAGVWAARIGGFHFGLWLLLLAGLIGAHATNNLVNDLVDRGKGIDVASYFRHDYGSNPMSMGLLTVRQTWGYALGTGLASGLVAAVFVYLRGTLALELVAAGAIFVLFYTWPLKWIGLGEPVVFVVWGPLMIAGGCFAITGRWSNQVLLASLPYGLTAATVLFGKHIEKLAPDKAKHIHTVPVLLGEPLARHVSIGLMVLAYAGTVALVAWRIYPPAALAVFLGIPVFLRAARAYLAEKPKACPERYPDDIWPAWYVALAVWHNCMFGTLLIFGLLGDTLWRR